MKNMKEEEAKIAKFHHQFIKTRTNHIYTAQIIK
jgi:hypothetical protein